MNMINVLGTTNGVALYDGNSVTCYPGSNQTDNGKLQLEFNMARFVTRLSSKNFCVTNPAFVVTEYTQADSTKQLQVSAGQASINGMDLIITDSILVNPPETTGEYYLALKLQRDDDTGTPGRGNVLGDLVIGASTIFQGVCLTYLDEKDTSNKDLLYLAKIGWNGSTFTIEEDEDKYGRISADDILCQINDIRHPDITRLLLQQWINKVPDWYVSKDGDVEFEAIEWLPGRSGTVYPDDDYGLGKYGAQIKADTSTTSHIYLKAPAFGIDDKYRKFKAEIFANYPTNYGTKVTIGNATLSYTFASGDPFNIETDVSFQLKSLNSGIITRSKTSNSAMCDSGAVSLIAYSNSGTASDITRLAVGNNILTFTGNKDSNLKEETTIVNGQLTKQLGKTIFTYTTGASPIFKMSNSNTDLFYIEPKVSIANHARVENTLYLGELNNVGANIDGVSTDNYINSTKLHYKITPAANTTLTADYNVYKAEFKNDSPYDSTKTSIDAEGLHMTVDDVIPKINWINSPNVTPVSLEVDEQSVSGSMKSYLNISADYVTMIHDLNVDGDITGNRVFGAVYSDYAEYFKKDENEEILPRDIVCIREDGLVHKVETKEDLDRIVGICSDTAGHILGGAEWKEEEKVVVGLVGKLYVNTDEDIKPGDLVEATTDNKVVKCYSRLSKLGIALDKAKDGKVLIIYNG